MRSRTRRGAAVQPQTAITASPSAGSGVGAARRAGRSIWQHPPCDRACTEPPIIRTGRPHRVAPAPVPPSAPAPRAEGVGAVWHDARVPTRSPRRVLPLLLALLVAAVALSGCARVRAALAVQPDDTVTGQVVVATPEKGPEDTGPPITLPPDLESDVDISEYRQDGYVGSVLRFDGLSFAQTAELIQSAGPDGDTVRFEMRRAGSRVLVGGAVDLTTVAVDRADFQLKINFPGQVLESNGDAESSEVSWTFTPGEVGDFSAVVAYPDPEAPSPVNWTLGIFAIVALASGAVVLLAHRTRNPPISR